MTNEWLAAGYRTEQVDIEGRKLIFRRATEEASLPPEGPSSDVAEKAPRRHAFFGWMKGLVTIAPETDLTQPAEPEWGDIAWGDAAENDQRGKGY